MWLGAEVPAYVVTVTEEALRFGEREKGTEGEPLYAVGHVEIVLA